MEIRRALKGQYHAALAMLRQTIERCPEEVWTSGLHPRPFWRIAYHALFYTHLYLMPSEDGFRPWERHRDGVNFLAEAPWPPHALPEELPPYSRDEILAYLDLVEAMVDSEVDRADLTSAGCGFPWYEMPKLDHQMMNIRHLQQHTGQLAERLYAAGVDLDWIGVS